MVNKFSVFFKLSVIIFFLLAFFWRRNFDKSVAYKKHDAKVEFKNLTSSEADFCIFEQKVEMYGRDFMLKFAAPKDWHYIDENIFEFETIGILSSNPPGEKYDMFIVLSYFAEPSFSNEEIKISMKDQLHKAINDSGEDYYLTNFDNKSYCVYPPEDGEDFYTYNLMVLIDELESVTLQVTLLTYNKDPKLIESNVKIFKKIISSMLVRPYKYKNDIKLNLSYEEFLLNQLII